MKTTGSRASAVSQTRGFGDLLYDKAGARPSLDLDFAGTSSLRDKITGEYLVNHTRASTGTYIDSEGLVKQAQINYITNHKSLSSGAGNESIVNPEGVEESIGFIAASQISSTSHKNHRFSGHSFSLGGDTTYAFSLYMRTDQGTAPIQMDTNDNAVQVVTVTDQWQRFSVVETSIASNPYRFADLLQADGTQSGYPFNTWGGGASKVYVWGAQLEKHEVTDLMKTSGTINSAPRFTHERVETGNLIEDSNLNASVLATTKASVENYAGLAPDGSYSATKISSSESGTNFRFAAIVPTNDVSHIAIKTVSCYLKAGEVDRASFFVSRSGNIGARFTLTGDGIAVAVGSENTARITKTDNGWYRCEVTNNNSAINQFRIGVDFGAIQQVNIPAGDGIYAWGFQIEEGEAASTFVPSIDTFTSRASNATYVDSAGLVKTAYKNETVYSEDFTDRGGVNGWSLHGSSGVILSANTDIAPNGTQTASKIAPTTSTSTGHFMFIREHIVGTTSIYAKAAGYNYVSLVRHHSDGSPNLSAGVSVNLTNGTVHSISSDRAEAEVLNVGNGWYRIILKPTNMSTPVGGTAAIFVQPHNGGTPDANFRVNFAGDGTSGVLVWGAMHNNNVTEAGEYVKTTGTSSGGARYSHDLETLTPTGLYLEPAATNFLNYSTDLSQSDWIVGSNASVTGTTIAPDGTDKAQVVVRDSSGTNSYIRQNNPRTQGVTYTASVYAKLISGSVPTSGDILSVEYHGGQTVQRATVAFNGNLTSEWKRFEVTFKNVFNQASKKFDVGLNPDNNAQIAFWGAQLEAGTFATSIIPTTNSTVTRAADVYTSTPNLTETFEPRGLLIEEARTNLLHYSSNPVNNWNAKGSATTVTANYATAPDGTNTAVRIQMPATSGTFFKQLTTGFSSSTVYTASFWGKSNGQPQIDFIGGPGGTPTVFTLSDRWERYTLTWTSSGTASNFGFDNGTTAFAVDALVWGMQVEAGSFATSYIPTNSSSTVTRSADVASISGDNFGTYRTNKLLKSDHIYDWASNSGGQVDDSIIKPYAYPNPLDGKFNAYKLKATGSGTDRVKSGVSVSGSDTVSVYVKPISNPCIVQIMFQNGNNGRANFDLINKTTGGDGTRTLHELSNGWFRLEWQSGNNLASGGGIEISTTADSLNTAVFQGSGSNEFYVYGSQVEEGSTATNYIPSTDTFTSRLGNATYVDSNGLIKTAYRNYAGYSNFIGGWQTAGSLTIANQTTILNPFNGYDGVAKLHGTLVSTPIAYLDGVNVQGTISVYAKAETSSTFNIVSQPIDQTTCSAVTFNLLTETIVDTYGGATGSIENVGNGWYRCIMLPSHVSRFIILNPHNTDSGNVVYSSIGRTTNTGAYGMYFYGIQNVDSTTEAGDYYLNTTATQSGAPRYSHDPETLVPTGLYLEAAATNFIPRSNSFHYSNKWLINGGSVAIDNSVAAPTGKTGKVVVFTEDTSTGSHNLNSNSASNPDVIIEGVRSSYSWFIKPLSDRRTLSLRINGIGSNTVKMAYNVSTKQTNAHAGTSGTSSQNVDWEAEPFIEEYANGWYRVGIKNVLIESTHRNPNITISSGEGDGIISSQHVGNYTGNGKATWALFGLQNENTPYPSSYIETDGAQVTRAADTFTSTATTVLDRDGGNKEAFFNQGGSRSVFANYEKSPTQSSRVFAVKPSSNFDSFLQYNDNTSNESKLRFKSSTGDHTLVVNIDKLLNKTAYGFDDNNSGSASNGVIGQTNTSLTLPTTTDNLRPLYMRIGMHMSQNSGFLNSPISRLTFWKTRLPNSSLINITK